MVAKKKTQRSSAAKQVSSDTTAKRSGEGARQTIALVASQERPGEYVLIDAETRAVIYGPFQSNDNALLVEARVRRQLRGKLELRFEWAPRIER